MANVVLNWERFKKLTEARARFPHEPCVCVQADPDARAIRVGKASAGLDSRYHGGTAYAIDAAMHRSGNLVFVAGVDNPVLLSEVEATLIWKHRAVLIYNNVGKLHPPLIDIDIAHAGDIPTFVV